MTAAGHAVRMTFDINWTAVLVASLSSFVIGFVWFNQKTFYPVWVRALGRDPMQEGTGPGMTATWLLLVAGIVAQAAVLNVVVNWSTAEPTWTSGLLVGLVLGAAIAAASSLGHRLFAGQGLVVWAIEVGQDVLGLAAMGAVIGAFGG